jgi:hypothetical protein
VNIFFVGLAVILSSELGWNRWLATVVGVAATLVVAAWLVKINDRKAAEANAPMAPVTDTYAG